MRCLYISNAKNIFLDLNDEKQTSTTSSRCAVGVHRGEEFTYNIVKKFYIRLAKFN